MYTIKSIYIDDRLLNYALCKSYSICFNNLGGTYINILLLFFIYYISKFIRFLGTKKQVLLSSKTLRLLNTNDEVLLSEITSSSDDEDTLSSGPALTYPCPPRSQATTT